MDLHGNVSRELAHGSDLITCYRMAPHEDHMETKERAVRNLVDLLASGAPRPVKAWVPVPVLLAGRADLHPDRAYQERVRGRGRGRGHGRRDRRRDMGRLRLGRRTAQPRRRGGHRHRPGRRLGRCRALGRGLLEGPRRLRLRRPDRHLRRHPGRGPGLRPAPLLHQRHRGQSDRRWRRRRDLGPDPTAGPPGVPQGRGPDRHLRVGARTDRRRDRCRRRCRRHRHGHHAAPRWTTGTRGRSP